MHRDKGLMVAAVAAAAVVACGDGMLGDTGRMMVDAGQAMVDAHSVADAQTPAGGIPAGVVVPFAGTVVPDGWLPCDGADVRRDDYPALFGAIGTAHGSGDGVATFSIPDYRGRFLRGVDDGAGRDPDAEGREAANDGGNVGDRVGSVQGPATAMPTAPFETAAAGAHSHTHSARASSALVGGGSFTSVSSGSAATRETSEAEDHSHVIQGGDSETRPVNAGVLYIIRAE